VFFTIKGYVLSGLFSVQRDHLLSIAALNGFELMIIAVIVKGGNLALKMTVKKYSSAGLIIAGHAFSALFFSAYVNYLNYQFEQVK